MPIGHVRGVHLRYEVIGQVGPWIALIPGARRSFAELVPLANQLAQAGARVLLHDRRNCGASDILIEGVDGEEEIWADDLAQLLRDLRATPAIVGGTSSGARTSVILQQRHPQVVRALVLIRVTGGAFAAGRLPGIYYGQFIEAAHRGGMEAVCAMPDYQERIQMNGANRDRLMAMDPARYIAVMTHWLAIFRRGPQEPMLGVESDVLRSIAVPTLVVPGNDRTHGSQAGQAVARLIPAAQLRPLPIKDTDEPLLPFSDWDPVLSLLASFITEFMQQVTPLTQETS